MALRKQFAVTVYCPHPFDASTAAETVTHLKSLGVDVGWLSDPASHRPASGRVRYYADSLLSGMPVVCRQIIPGHPSEFEDFIQQIPAHDVIMMHQSFVAIAYLGFRKRDTQSQVAPLLLVEHNDESAIWKDMARTPAISFVRRISCLLESMKIKRQLRRVYRQCQRIGFLSARDLSSVRHLIPEDTYSCVLPVIMPMPQDHKQDYRRKGELTYFGTLGSYPSIDALCWLIGEIMPHVWLRDPGCRLKIIGNIPGDVCGNEVSRLLRSDTRIEQIAPLNSNEADALLCGSDIVLSPIRLGGGIKIKNLVAAGLAIPLITTSAGLRGSQMIPGRDCICADTTAAFADAILSLMHDEEKRRTLGMNGRRYLADHHAGDAAAGQWLQFAAP